MPSLPTGDSGRWIKQIQDTLADNSKIRDGLHDDEAIPLMDWGASCAEHIGTQWSISRQPHQEQVDEAAYTLARLMTRVNWLVTFRHKKDAGWLSKTLLTINKLSTQLHGDDAPVFSEQEITAWVADHAQYTDGVLLRGLITKLTPAGLAPSPPPTAMPTVLPSALFGGKPEPQAQPAPPVTPLSDTLFGEQPQTQPDPPAAPLSDTLFGEQPQAQSDPEPQSEPESQPDSLTDVLLGALLGEQPQTQPDPPAAPLSDALFGEQPQAQSDPEPQSEPESQPNSLTDVLLGALLGSRSNAPEDTEPPSPLGEKDDQEHR